MSLSHVETLRSLVTPLGNGPVVDWAMAEGEFGLAYPADFKAFVETYGSSLWCDLFRPIYPDTSSPEACEGSRRRVVRILEAIFASNLYDEDGQVVAIPSYPAAGGLFPCFEDTNSDIVCWHMVGSPEEWTVKFYQQGNLFSCPCDATQFVCDWWKGISPAATFWGRQTEQPTLRR